MIFENEIKNRIDGSIAPIREVAKLYIPSKEVYPLGINAFDKAMDGGVRDGELIVVSGGTGEGKTTFCINLSINLSKKSIPSLFFSYEMDNYYLYQNFLKIEQNLDLIYSPIELISSQLNFIEQQIKEGVEKKAIKVVFIDHLHFLIPLKSAVNTSLMIGALVRELKKMAVKNKVIIFLIAHTRKINTGDELNLSSIRDSGLVVAESDYVFLVERLRKQQNKITEFITKTNVSYTNKSRITLAKNRRTGKLLYKDFFVNDGKFIEETKEYEHL